MQSPRTQSFLSYSQHAWLYKAFKRLRKPELELCLKFIEQHDHLSKGDFELAVNRMFLGATERPKNWTICLELLTCANSAQSSA